MVSRRRISLAFRPPPAPRRDEAGVVVRAFRHAVGAGVEDGKQVSWLDGREFAVTGEEVARLADRADDIDDARFPFPRGYRHDLVIGLVERGTDEVVHGGVGDHKGLLAVALDLKDARHESAGLRDDKAARLDEQTCRRSRRGRLGGRQRTCGLGGGVEVGGVIVDAQASAGIDCLGSMPSRRSWRNSLNPFHGRAKGVRGANLRADVEADAMRLKPSVAGRALVDRQRLANIDAEFVLAQAGGDVRVGLGKNVGINAQGEARFLLSLAARAANRSSSASLSTLI